jgi:transposase
MARMDDATRRRVIAGRLMLAGKTPAEAAKAVGVARQTAYTWKARLDEGGIDALRAMAPGRPAQLDGAQLDALGSALLRAGYGCSGLSRVSDFQSIAILGSGRPSAPRQGRSSPAS